MTWDESKDTNQTRPNVPSKEKITSADWNAMVTDQKAHSTRHESGGVDELSVEGLSGVLADPQPVDEELIDDFVADLLVGGDKLSYTYDDQNDTLTIDTTALDSQEVKDEIDTTIAGGSQVSTSYDGTILTVTIDAPTQAAFDDHSSRHESGGIDELNVSSLNGVLADPQPPAGKGDPGGVAELNDQGVLRTGQVPDLSISDTFTVTNESDLTTLTAQIGDIGIVTSQSETYILTASDATILDNWVEIQSPEAPVQDVFGRTGSVDAQSGDYSASQIDNLTETVQDITGGLLSGGTNISLTYDDANDILTVDTSALNQEEVEDAVGALVTAGNAITVNYDDPNDTLSIAVNESGLSFYDGTNLTANVDNNSVTTDSANVTNDVTAGSVNTGQLRYGRSGALVSISADQSIDADTVTQIEFDEAIDDPNGLLDLQNNTVVAPSGVDEVFISAAIGFKSLNNVTLFRPQINNSSAPGLGRQDVDAASALTLSSGFIDISDSDEISIQVRTETASTLSKSSAITFMEAIFR